MKRVAFLSFDWDYKIVSEYYLGLQEHLRDQHDIQVVIFNSFAHYYASHQPRKSTFEIYSLCDLGEYDGFIVQGNRSWPPDLRQEFVDKAVANGKPVVSINYDLIGAHSVGTNNYLEEYELVTRVLLERECKHPVFVNGLKTSVEAQARAKGYRDACEQLGVEDVRFYQANWQKSAGVVTAKKMLRKRYDLPDVVFCCNDDLAVGVLETLQDAGVDVPGNIMVTGFDNRVVGQRSQPRITSVDRDYRAIAVTALGMVMQLIGGEDVPAEVFSPARHILTESCGYVGAADASSKPDCKPDEELDRFYEILGDFQFAALGSESLYTIFENCEQFARELDCPNAYISLNDGYINQAAPRDANTYGRLSHLVACRGRARTFACDDEHVYTTYETRRFLPPEIAFDAPLYMLSPLRHNEACIGLLITEGVPKALRYGFNAFFLSVLSSSIEAARKSDLLRMAHARLGYLTRPAYGRMSRGRDTAPTDPR